MRAELADGTVLEFPDGTDPAVIQQTVKNVIAQKNQPAITPENIDIDQVPRETQQIDDTVSRLGIPRTLGGEQALGTIASGIIAEPVAGAVGAISAPFVGVDQAVKNIDATREALTLKPDNQQAIENLQTVAKVAEPLTSALTGTEDALGDFAFE